MTLARRRPGFTLLELLTVMMIIGLLATIAMTRFWSLKERGYWASVRSDLRNTAMLQERYYEKNMAYASDVTELPDVTESAGVIIAIKWASNEGWAATGEHNSNTGHFCGYYTGPAPAGIAAPATQPGVIKCDD